jgi:hypothetical protein
VTGSMLEMNVRMVKRLAGKRPGKMPDGNFDICGLTNFKIVAFATKFYINLCGNCVAFEVHTFSSVTSHFTVKINRY